MSTFQVTEETIIGDLLDQDPSTGKFLMDIGMHCLGCPMSRGETLAEACEVHGVKVEELVAKINAYLKNQG
ncbi:MAG: DUF1858 domain-containing protein [Clostridia bacterium]|nr:DUF1858 domain-containing protein [Clostridia bacterium]MBQ7727699.1 DUF1858 domain-containing protein [Clostridia bacterium]